MVDFSPIGRTVYDDADRRILLYSMIRCARIALFFMPQVNRFHRGTRGFRVNSWEIVHPRCLMCLKFDGMHYRFGKNDVGSAAMVVKRSEVPALWFNEQFSFYVFSFLLFGETEFACEISMLFVIIIFMLNNLFYKGSSNVSAKVCNLNTTFYWELHIRYIISWYTHIIKLAEVRSSLSMSNKVKNKPIYKVDKKI